MAANITELVSALTALEYRLNNTENALQTEIESNTMRIDDVVVAVDSVWLLLCGTFVFMMQTGFSMLEAGSVRQKNTSSILLKNLLDCLLGALAFWLVGFAFAFGDEGPTSNGFIGNTYFAGTFIRGSGTVSNAFWFFQFTFCATATTIVSGAMAERTRFRAYLVYSVFVSGWIYPVVVHWVWSSNGWLSAFRNNPLGGSGMIDFAGSGVVHTVGGCLGLIGTVFLGPRAGRFDKDPETGKRRGIPGHSVVLQTLGCFILWVGWICFNSGSTLAMTDGFFKVAAVAAMNSMIAPASAAVTGLFLGRLIFRSWSLVVTINSILSGLVAITAGCSVVQPWSAFLIGIIAGLLFLGGTLLMRVIRVDDPVDAVTVHGINGVWGVISVGIFASKGRVEDAYGQNDHYGWIYGGDGVLFGVNILGIICILIWCSFWGILLFGIMRVTGFLRITKAMEKAGVDKLEHGDTPAWPEFEMYAETTANPFAVAKDQGEGGSSANAGDSSSDNESPKGVDEDDAHGGTYIPPIANGDEKKEKKDKKSHKKGKKGKKDTEGKNMDMAEDVGEGDKAFNNPDGQTGERVVFDGEF